MNANDQFFARDAQVDAAAVAPMPASRKIYVQGSRADLRVPMREITQSETPASFGTEKNPPLAVYDTSGPYTDPSTSAAAGRRCGPHGSPSATIRSNSTARHRAMAARGFPIRNSLAFASTSCARRGVRRQAPTCRRCTMRAAASSRRRWNSSRSARINELNRWPVRIC